MSTAICMGCGCEIEKPKIFTCTWDDSARVAYFCDLDCAANTLPKWANIFQEGRDQDAKNPRLQNPNDDGADSIEAPTAAPIPPQGDATPRAHPRVPLSSHTTVEIRSGLACDQARGGDPGGRVGEGEASQALGSQERLREGSPRAHAGLASAVAHTGADYIRRGGDLDSDAAGGTET